MPDTRIKPRTGSPSRDQGIWSPYYEEHKTDDYDHLLNVVRYGKRAFHLQEAERAEKRVCEVSLFDFLEQAWPIIEPGTPFVGGWHLEALCAHLEMVFFRVIRNLLVNVPPRTSKSIVTSVAFPAWCWIHRPFEKFLFASYSSSFSERDGRRTRDLIMSDWYQKRWGDRFHLKKDANTIARFENNHNGYRIATSVGGAVLGEGASILVADDIQNVQAATFSDAIRTQGNNFMRRVFSTRMNDPKTGCRINIQQRFHQDDASGQIISRDKTGRWVKLVLPMSYETDRKCRTVRIYPLRYDSTQNGVVVNYDKPVDIWEDPRTEPGELLCLDRFGPEELEQLREDLEVWDEAGQLQQRPAPPGGGTFDAFAWRHYYRRDLPSEIIASCLSWDLPVKGKARSAFMVGQLWVWTDDGNMWLVDQRRMQAAYRKQKEVILEMFDDYPWVDAVVVEDAATGPAVEEDLMDDIPTLILMPAEGDKEARAAGISTMQSNGKILLPMLEECPWLKDFLDEVNTFPNSAYKDQVDTMTQAARWFRKQVKGRRRRRTPARNRAILVAGF